MKLYRAVYQMRSGAVSPKRITFAAPDATAAHNIAGWFETGEDFLLTVKLIRPLVWQLDLDVGDSHGN